MSCVNPESFGVPVGPQTSEIPGSWFYRVAHATSLRNLRTFVFPRLLWVAYDGHSANGDWTGGEWIARSSLEVHYVQSQGREIW